MSQKSYLYKKAEIGRYILILPADFEQMSHKERPLKKLGIKERDAFVNARKDTFINIVAGPSLDKDAADVLYTICAMQKKKLHFFDLDKVMRNHVTGAGMALYTFSDDKGNRQAHLWGLWPGESSLFVELQCRAEHIPIWESESYRLLGSIQERQ